MSAIHGIHKVRLVNVRPKVGHNSFWGSGNITLKQDVLEQLPRYFEQLQLLRHADPDMYAMQARLGASIASRSSSIVIPDRKTAGDFISEIPAFGCTYIHDDRTDAEITADSFLRVSFICWTKINKPLYPGIAARAGKNIYHVVVIHHDPEKRKPVPMQWHMSVPTIAEMTPLKELSRYSVVLRKRGRRRIDAKSRERGYSVPCTEWRWPACLRAMSEDHLKSDPTMTPLTAGTRLFLLGVTALLSRRSGFQVRVRKDGLTAAFNIDDGSTTEFFKDRDVMVNENGRTKKIFHYVPGYQRLDGTPVQPHTKGLRSFRWSGYDVHIGKPEHDFVDPARFTAAAHVDPDPTFLGSSLPDVGRLVANHISTNALLAASRGKAGYWKNRGKRE